MAKKVLKYSALAVAGLAVVLSIAFNASSFYKGYANSLRVEGYTQAMNQIEATLKQSGKLELSQKNPDGTLSTIVLVPEVTAAEETSK